MSYHYGYLVESMVSILLLLTILYCVRLNKQLRLLKADEQTLRATISELITATPRSSNITRKVGHCAPRRPSTTRTISKSAKG